MKKALFIILFATQVYAADIVITVPDAYLPRVKEALLARYPKPPSFVGTDIQWIKHILTRHIKEQVKIYETDQAFTASVNSVNVPDDMAK